ncbi:MAG: hypothetical protein ABI325_01470 [Ginsengibacter sp.]
MEVQFLYLVACCAAITRKEVVIFNYFFKSLLKDYITPWKSNDLKINRKHNIFNKKA